MEPASQVQPAANIQQHHYLIRSQDLKLAPEGIPRVQHAAAIQLYPALLANYVEKQNIAEPGLVQKRLAAVTAGYEPAQTEVARVAAVGALVQ